MTDKFISGGTYTSQEYPGGLYPETFYSGKAPLDDRLFRQFVNKTCPPLTSFSACNEYASVGGVTQADLVAEHKVEPTCDPVLPLDQNQYSESHYAGPFCISDCKGVNTTNTPATNALMGAPTTPIMAAPMDSGVSFQTLAIIAALFILLMFISRNK